MTHWVQGGITREEGTVCDATYSPCQSAWYTRRDCVKTVWWTCRRCTRSRSTFPMRTCHSWEWRMAPYQVESLAPGSPCLAAPSCGVLLTTVSTETRPETPITNVLSESLCIYASDIQNHESITTWKHCLSASWLLKLCEYLLIYSVQSVFQGFRLTAFIINGN